MSARGKSFVMESPRQAAGRISGWYALVGVIWIIGSDRLLGKLVPDPAWHPWAQTIKGWLFIVVTAALVYFLVLRLCMVLNQVLNELRAHREQLEGLVRARTAALEEAHRELLQKERLATLGQLTATVSHELRNPLGTVRSSLFALQERVRGQSPDVDRIITRADRNIRRCDGIIDELLDYSRTAPPYLERVELGAWLNAALDELEVPGGVNVVREIPSGIEAQLDRERFRRCVTNLAQNAFHALQEKGAAGHTLRISVAADESHVRLSFADDGPGIAAEHLARVFEPLFSTRSFGVGLGLPVVRQVVEQHGGTVTMESVVGSGTVVTVMLPRVARQAVAPRKEVE